MTRTYWMVLKLCDKDENPGEKTLPVFADKAAAERFSKGKFDVKPIEHVENKKSN